MTFEVPWALAAAAGLLPLWLWSRRRRRPVRHVWPSLLLWLELPGSEAGARARRGRDPLFWLEAAALLLLTLGAAGPSCASATAGRRVVVVRDMSPRMYARIGPETVAVATLQQLDVLRTALDPEDEVREVIAEADLESVMAGVADADLRVVATNRKDLVAKGWIILGVAPDRPNIGIDAVHLRDGKLWFALATDGPPVAVRVRVAGRTLNVRTGVGTTVDLGESAGPWDLELLDGGNHPGDDRCRVEAIRLAVRLDAESAFLKAALFGAGVPAHPAAADETPDLVIVTTGGDPTGPVPARTCIVEDPALDGLSLQDVVWPRVRARSGPGMLRLPGSPPRSVVQRTGPATYWVGAPLDREWDEHGTLALFLETLKREAATRRAGNRALGGEAFLEPRPGAIDTAGRTRLFAQRLPDRRRRLRATTSLRGLLGGLAAGVLGLYLAAIVRRRT